jgi:EpsI family protein
MKNKHSRFWALMIVLLAGGVVINLWEHVGEELPERRPLAEFPTQLGAWRQAGADTRFDRATEEVLRADDYISRDYVQPDMRARANIYVGYYRTQRTGATYHSPLNCLPGSGWILNEPGTERIAPVGGQVAPFDANRYVIQNGNNRFVMLYWYQGRGRAVASEYWDKIYTVLDSARRRRSDGSMVRIMLPISGSDQDALGAARNIAAELAPHLGRHIPD